MRAFDEWYINAVTACLMTNVRGDKHSITQKALTIDLSKGTAFPILSVKRSPWRLAAKELFWFMSPSLQYTDLRDSGCTWWDPWIEAYLAKHDWLNNGYRLLCGDYVMPYKRHRSAFDRIAKDLIENGANANRTRLYANLWPYDEDLDEAVLPPCALAYQVTIGHDERLNLTVTQRSADLVCGVPANVAQYYILLRLYAELAGLKPGCLMFVYGDLHVYTEHAQSNDIAKLLDFDLGKAGRYELLGIDKVAQSYKDKGYIDVSDANLLSTNTTYQPAQELKFEVVKVHT